MIATVHRELPRLARDAPRIAVAVLNPHAGEGGPLRREEPRRDRACDRRAAAAGIDAPGPFPADTLFRRAYARPSSTR